MLIFYVNWFCKILILLVEVVNLEQVRITGVLQRFSITYLILGLLLITFRDITKKGSISESQVCLI